MSRMSVNPYKSPEIPADDLQDGPYSTLPMVFALWPLFIVPCFCLLFAELPSDIERGVEWKDFWVFTVLWSLMLAGCWFAYHA